MQVGKFMSIEKYITRIIEREGGFVDHPSDKGGPTKFGITLTTLSEWRKKDVSKDDVNNLQTAEAYEIYKTKYLLNSGINNIADDHLKALMLDAAVNHGISRAVKFLQEALKIQQDGVIGPVTIQCANAASIPLLKLKYLAIRIRFYGAIITDNPTQAVFAKGWLNRSAELLEELI